MRIAASLAAGFIVLAASEASTVAQTSGLSCHGAQQSKQVAELLFGRNIGHGVGVSESAWARFVLHELMPRFPDGLNVTDATGHWRDPTTGTIVREPAKRVEIVLAGAADDEPRLAAVVKAYEQKFRQHSVGIIVRPACVSF
jgi:Protein of unknown function (DUF3574)